MVYEVNFMRSLLIIVIVGMLLFPSVIVVSPEVDIRYGKDTSNISDTRSGPQTYQDEMGGWWMQDEDEDFEQGEFEYALTDDNAIKLDAEPMDLHVRLWGQLYNPLCPSKRESHDMVFDSHNKRVILFGGDDGNRILDETWVYNISSSVWTKLNIQNPTRRVHHRMVYDSHNKKVVLFGSHNYEGNTWVFDVTTDTWTKHDIPGPRGRQNPAMAYDSFHKKVILFGGYYYEYGAHYLDDTWVFDCATNTWNEIITSGPAARYNSAMTFDKAINKCILHGGNNRPYETWTFDLGSNTWTKVANNGPYIDFGHSIVYYDHPLIKKNIMFGSNNVNNQDQTWEFDSSTNRWTQLLPSEDNGRRYAKLVYNDFDHEIFMFGGKQDNQEMNDTWIFKYPIEYFSEGSYTSPVIELQEGFTFYDLNINATETTQTKLVVSLLDADTGLYIEKYREMEPRYVDISSLQESRIRLRCHLKGDGKYTPILHSWNITWRVKVAKPEYTYGIPSPIPVIEDTPRNGILDLSKYFRETRSDSLSYDFGYISDTENVSIEINGSKIDVTNIENNWTGSVDLIVNCSNLVGEFALSEQFSIIVIEVNDPPAWISRPPSISFQEDSSYKTNYTLFDYITDAENDIIDLQIQSDNENYTIYVGGDGRLTIEPSLDHFGESEIRITASERYNPVFNIEIAIPMTTEPVNDNPTASLLYPGNNAVINSTNVTLIWNANDVDNSDEDLYFDLFFDKKANPVFSNSDVRSNTFDMDDLSDKSTYYWYVNVHDGAGGLFETPKWSFRVDTESEEKPGTTNQTEIINTGDVNLIISTDTDQVVIERGNESIFNITIINGENEIISLAIVPSGDASPCLSMRNFITLSPNETITETVKVTRTSFLQPGNYSITLVFIHPEGITHLSIPLWIQPGTSEGESGDGTKNESNPDDGKNTNGEGDIPTESSSNEDSNVVLFLIVLFILVFLIVFSVAFIFIKFTRMFKDYEKSKDETDAVLEPESYVPDKSTFQPKVEDRTPIPLSPGPYQPPELPGRPFQPRIATFQSQQSPAPQLPTSQLVPVVPTIAAQPMPEADIPAILGTTPTVPSTESPISQQSPGPLQAPVPLVQLPPTTGVIQQQEQKMLPENATGVPPPPPI